METDKKPNGALIGLIVVIVILIVGGIAIWASTKNAEERALETESGTVTENDANDLNSIENDLEGSDTSVDVTNVE